MNRIETLRNELRKLVNAHGMQHPIVMRKSRQLDKVIIQYCLFIYLQEIEKKHKEVRRVSSKRKLFEPQVMRKSRELDKAIIDYIQIVSVQHIK